MAEPAKPPSKLESAVEDNRSLLDPALDNLSTARQFIDEGLFPYEQKLISFYYAFALLTRHREDPEKRALAKRFFVEAADWKDNAVAEQMKWQSEAVDERLFANADVLPHEEEIQNAVTRIKLESFYNLGVLHHLDKEYEDALKNYSEAATNAKALLKNFRGLELLARFGRVSATIEATWVPSTRKFTFNRVPRFKLNVTMIREELEQLRTDLTDEVTALGRKRDADSSPARKSLPAKPDLDRSGFLGTIREWIQGKEPPYEGETLPRRGRITTDRFLLERMIDKLDEYRKYLPEPEPR